MSSRTNPALAILGAHLYFAFKGTDNQYLTRCAEAGGLFFDHTCGISLGCALSPLIGAFFLHRLDVAMERVGLFYVRYMDDVRHFTRR